MLSSYRLVEKELIEFEKRYAEAICSDDTFVKQLVSHITRFQGKRIRPLLVFLSAKANGKKIEEIHYKIAVVIELMHQATLIHDDVLDKATIRRNLDTINNVWGNETSILLGDFIFARLFNLTSEIDSKEVIKALSVCACEMCTGELQQNYTKFFFDMSVENYISMIKRKTASLFSVACRLGAEIGDSKPLYSYTIFEQFGLNIGVAFQIIDDYLDIFGEENLMGKSLGSDLEKGKLTLPLILLLEKSNNNSCEEIKKIIQGDNVPNKRALIKEKLLKYDITIDSDKNVKDYIKKAREIIEIIEDKEYKKAFLEITDYVVERNR